MRGRDRRVAGSRSGPRGRLEATPPGVGRDRLSAVARDVVACAPPENKPAPVEMARCRAYLARELALLPRVRVILALGRVGFEACRRLLAAQGADVRAMRFAHGAACAPGPAFPTLIASYHPSRQNTNTGKLTEPMLDRVFEMARDLLDERGSGRRIGDV